MNNDDIANREAAADRQANAREVVRERGSRRAAKSAVKAERKRQVADRIDGYDRDDLGESPDY